MSGCDAQCGSVKLRRSWRDFQMDPIRELWCAEQPRTQLARRWRSTHPSGKPGAMPEQPVHVALGPAPSSGAHRMPGRLELQKVPDRIHTLRALAQPVGLAVLGEVDA